MKWYGQDEMKSNTLLYRVQMQFLLKGIKRIFLNLFSIFQLSLFSLRIVKMIPVKMMMNFIDTKFFYFKSRYVMKLWKSDLN